ncbi:CYP1A1 [Mytilus edulis]|uniref:CYP1A1 n=1 Tax=Mytilus edulis TaxID=6550 RepID=A0A8S3Q787_MYTED|nr:CYP1A1 [Mytilus edulis]
MFGALLVPVVLGKLPSEIHKNIARDHDSDNISLIELRKSIVKEIKILEVGQTTEYGDSHMTATFFAGAKSRQQPHYDHKQTKGTHACVFSDGTHHSNECTQRIRLPWKQEHDQLPTNFSIAKRRTESVIRRLDREPAMVDMFNQSNITLTCVFIFTLIAIGVYRRRIRSKDQPPGPWGLPFVGYLPFFSKNPPRKCTQLAKTYGDIFCIRLGSWPTIVLNSKAAIREALVEQSDTFSDRPDFFSCKVVNNMRSLGFGSYNARWRLHSKIASTVLREFASPNKPTTEKIIMMEAEKLTEYFLENTHTPFDPHEEIFLAVGSVVYQICCGMDKDCRNDKGYLNLIKTPK